MYIRGLLWACPGARPLLKAEAAVDTPQDWVAGLGWRGLRVGDVWVACPGPRGREGDGLARWGWTGQAGGVPHVGPTALNWPGAIELSCVIWI